MTRLVKMTSLNVDQSNTYVFLRFENPTVGVVLKATDVINDTRCQGPVLVQTSHLYRHPGVEGLAGAKTCREWLDVLAAAARAAKVAHDEADRPGPITC